MVNLEIQNNLSGGSIYCYSYTYNTGSSLSCVYVKKTTWFDNYSTFAPYFLDMMFLVGLFLFLWFLLKFTFKTLFK